MDQSPATSTGEMDHPGVYCDACDKLIKGFRYKCLECDNFDLCQSCESDYHSGHVICRFTDPITESDKEFLKNILNRRPHDKPFLIQGFHDQETCNLCGREYVEGFLYKCCDCGLNACRRCEKQDSKCIAGKSHSLFRFADPLSLNSFNKRFWQEILEIRSSMRNPKAFKDNFLTELTKHEGTKCNVCDNDVLGVRFKCIDCDEFNLCSACESKNIHEGHLLIRFGRPLDLQMQKFYSIIVRIRMTNNSRSFNEDKRSNWNSNHSCITCNNCQSTIHGYRYKCLHCMDIDLCSFCQKKECHTEHWMVRLTEPLSQNKFDQSFVEAVLRSKRPSESTPMRDLSHSMHRRNVMGRSEDYINYDNRFTLNYEQYFQERAIPNCTVCFMSPSEIMMMDCGHLCICTNCIVDFMRSSSPQCPICRVSIKSIHRAFY